MLASIHRKRCALERMREPIASSLLAVTSIVAQAGLPLGLRAQDRPPIDAPEEGLGAPLPSLSPFELTVVGDGTPLELRDVLDSVDAYHPPLASAAARIRSARGSLLAAEGGFDLLLQAQGWVAPLGYYQYGRADVSLVQPTPLWGLSVFTGWRIGRGIDEGGIPPYYGNYETLDLGEVRAGVTLPLWRDGPIDARRAGITRAEQSLDAAEAEREGQRLRVMLAATEAYWSWVAAGLKLVVAQQVLGLAQVRDEQVAARVRAGAIPAIEHVENRRAVLERRQQVIASRRALERAAIQLSLYYRSDAGEPRIPDASRLPARIPPPPTPPDAAPAIRVALEQRPELARYRALTAAARVQIELADNQVAPRVDVSAQAVQDIGGGMPDELSYEILARPVVETWVLVSMPLQLREARGRADAARADLGALEEDVRLTRDRIALEVRDALSALGAALESLALAQEMLDVAERVAVGERARFEAGATSLLIVNLREAAFAAAESTVVDARAEAQRAFAMLLVAMGEEPRAVRAGGAGGAGGAGASEEIETEPDTR